MNNFELSWLENPEIFNINRLEATSDHKYYKNKEEALNDKSSFLEQLNGSWKFAYAKNLDEVIPNFYEEDFDMKDWGNITVPGHIQLQGYDKPHYVNTMYSWDGHDNIQPPQIPKRYNPVGCYIREFEIPSDWQEGPVYISFQGVETALYLWVNGNFIGFSEDSFTPSEFDLTKYIKSGINRLAVMVVKFSSASWIEDQDFWRFSGIFRDVYLYTYPKTHIRDIFIKTDLKNNYNDSDLTVEMKLQGQLSGEVRVKLLYNNNLVKEFYKNDLKEKMVIRDEVKDVNLWSAEEPNLYSIEFEILNDGQVVEVISEKIGFREFKMKNKIMHINGKRIVFKGVNRHEFNCYNGRNISKEDMIWDIKCIKRNNINAVRTSHYPNQSYFYKLCDLYGLYVIDETNLESHGTWQKMGLSKPDFVVPGSKPQWREAVLDRGKSMVERDKNHPSIVIWSCGNEAYGGENIYLLSEYFRSKDPSRIVHYEGVFWDRTYDDTSDMESRMYAKVWDIEEYLNSQPEKPFVLCEYTHSMGNSNGAMHKYVELADKYPMYQGGFIWDFIDQAIMTKNIYGEDYLAVGGDFGDRPTDYNFCGNGIVFADRVETPKMQEVKYNYQNIKIDVRGNIVVIKNNNLFINLDKYDFTFKHLKEGKIVEIGRLDISIEPGEEKEILIPITIAKEVGNYVVDVIATLKEDTIWEDKGYEVAFGQYQYSVDSYESQLRGEIVVSDCDVNFGVRGDKFEVIFSKNYGGMISYKYEGNEFINDIPKPNFWHGITDNDKGNFMAFNSAQWKIASLYAKSIKYDIKYDNNSATIMYTYKLPTEPESQCTVAYTTFGDGTVKIKQNYKGTSNLPNMLDFGMIFKVPKKYENLTWYGRGKEENYIDKNKGARIGLYSNKVCDNLTKYLMPQESGNKTDVKWFNVVDGEGKGIEIKGSNFEFSALPYSPHELENANHHYELPRSFNTVIRVSLKHIGVGGDDSWGAMPHDEYLIPADRDMELEFYIKGIVKS